MILKSNKGYSLVEIGVGIIILTIFLIVSIGMFNGAYNNYRRIKQRNIAVDAAVRQIEAMLQTDANELTGFFVRELDASTNRYVLKPSDKLVQYVENDVNHEFNTDDPEKYIEENTNKCINSYIQNRISENLVTDEELASGDYGFIIGGNDSNKYLLDLYGQETVSQEAVVEGNDYINSNLQVLRMVKTVKRLPAEDGKAYGNEVLKLRIEVFYSDKFGTNIDPKDMDSIAIETIKVTNTAK